MKWGIDVSRWQGNFNFAKAKQEGVEFAILKAGGGDAGLYKDGKFDRNYTECMKNNIPAGAYFFGCAMDTATAIKEADYFCKLIAGRTYPMKVWYDVEAKMLKSKYLANIVVTFIERVKSYGYECGIYASASTLKTLCKTPAINNYPHWVAQWTKKPPTIATEIWQFGGETNLIRSNKVAGVVCDQNYLMDTTVEKPVTTEKPAEEDVKMKQIKKGSKGNAVKVWQIIIGETADGIFGEKTLQKTLALQKKKGLVQDGIVGQKTWKAGLESLK